MSTEQIVVSVCFVMVVSVVSYFFGKYDGYRMGLSDAVDLTCVTIDRTLEALEEDEEDEDY